MNWIRWVVDDWRHNLFVLDDIRNFGWSSEAGRRHDFKWCHHLLAPKSEHVVFIVGKRKQFAFLHDLMFYKWFDTLLSFYQNEYWANIVIGINLFVLLFGPKYWHVASTSFNRIIHTKSAQSINNNNCKWNEINKFWKTETFYFRFGTNIAHTHKRAIDLFS